MFHVICYKGRQLCAWTHPVKVVVVVPLIRPVWWSSTAAKARFSNNLSTPSPVFAEVSKYLAPLVIAKFWASSLPTTTLSALSVLQATIALCSFSSGKYNKSQWIGTQQSHSLTIHKCSIKITDCLTFLWLLWSLCRAARNSPDFRHRNRKWLRKHQWKNCHERAKISLYRKHPYFVKMMMIYLHEKVLKMFHSHVMCCASYERRFKWV